MTPISPSPTPRTALLPVVAIVFLGFLSIAITIGALPLQLHDTLGFGTTTVGWAIGLQSLATILTRHRAGTICDTSGPRRAVLLGLPLTATSGLLYLLAAPLPPGPALAAILAGRITMGFGESLFVTACLAWGIARLGPPRTGTVMSWQGIALYAALGLGAPIGLALQTQAGFAAAATAAIAAPLAALGLALPLQPTPATGGQRVPVHHILASIWRPGLVLALATMPFAAMSAFLALAFAALHWQGAGTALAGFGAGYIAVRLLFPHLTDRLGGVPVAAASLAIEATGQALLFLAPTPALAIAGATLTGIGFSLVFPAMGVIATRAVPPQQRGRAVGGFVAFFDLALALTGPAAGFISARTGPETPFLLGTIATLAALTLIPLVQAATRPKP